MKINITGTIALIGGFVREFENNEYTLPEDLTSDVVADIEEYLQNDEEVDEDLVIQIFETWICHEYLEEMLEIDGVIDLEDADAEIELSYGLPYNNMDELYEDLNIEVD